MNSNIVCLLGKGPQGPKGDKGDIGTNTGTGTGTQYKFYSNGNENQYVIIKIVVDDRTSKFMMSKFNMYSSPIDDYIETYIPLEMRIYGTAVRIVLQYTHQVRDKNSGKQI